MLGVDERGCAALLLNLRDDLQRQRRLARRLGPVDLDDSAARQAADAERDVEAERSRRHDVDVARGDRIAQAHDGTLAELLLDLPECCGKGFLAVVVHKARSMVGGKLRLRGAAMRDENYFTVPYSGESFETFDFTQKLESSIESRYW